MTTILLIEPHADSARTYAESLQRAGFRVEITTTPDVVRQDLAPNVVVISVPRAERSLLRVFAHGRSVPRIVLSSEASDANRAAELDCAAVLIRPVMYDHLVKEVRRVLKAAGAEQPA
jgi:DNA-binding response OmpR family regulator